MTMDLWYDLAARELPDLDRTVVEKLNPTDAAELAEPEAEPEAEPAMATATDFF